MSELPAPLPPCKHPSVFEDMAAHIYHPTFALLWEIDPKTNRLIKPHVTFTPKFPGDGFNHDVVMRSYAVLIKLQCPCGTETIIFYRNRLDRCLDDAAIVICSRCLSWHTITFK